MRVGIFGVGAIGGSIGLRARANGAIVLGFDCDQSALDAARTLGAIDELVGRAELPHRVDVLVIAAHLEAALDEIVSLRGETGAFPELVLDVSSVKRPVVTAAQGLRNFVASHPMAGTQNSGVRAARADLFEERPWAYVPTRSAALDARAREFIGSLGGVPVAMSAEEHDRIVAITSHVPQVVAGSFARLLHGSEPGAERLCGPVARELLRISTMSDAMWRDVLAANAENVEQGLRRLIAELEGYLSRASTAGVTPQSEARRTTTD